MYSSEDLERFYFQYQTEAVPHGVSLQSFCSTHNVPYNLFIMVQGYPQKNSRSSGGWCSPGSALGFRSVFSFSGKPGQEGHSFPARREQSPESVPRGACASRAYIRGADLEQWSAYPPKDLDYPGLYRLIQKLEVLC